MRGGGGLVQNQDEHWASPAVHRGANKLQMRQAVRDTVLHCWDGAMDSQRDTTAGYCSTTVRFLRPLVITDHFVTMSSSRFTRGFFLRRPPMLMVPSAASGINGVGNEMGGAFFSLNYQQQYQHILMFA